VLKNSINFKALQYATSQLRTSNSVLKVKFRVAKESVHDTKDIL